MACALRDAEPGQDVTVGMQTYHRDGKEYDIPEWYQEYLNDLDYLLVKHEISVADKKTALAELEDYL